MGLKLLIVRRILLTIPVAIGVVTLIFITLSAMTPTMRVAYFVGSRPMFSTKESIAIAIHENGLDQPIIIQYFNWLKKIATLDFGRSMSIGSGEEGPPVVSMIIASLPTTLELLMYSLPPILLLSIWLGTKAVIERNKKMDYLARVLGVLGASVPVFVVAVVLLVVSLVIQNPYHIVLDPYLQLSYNVRYELNLRIMAGNFSSYTNMISIDALLNGDFSLFLDAMLHLALPIATLVITQCAALTRVTRSGLLEEVGKPYMITARGKGFSEKQAVYSHARRNASISVLTLLGLFFGNMFIGLVIVERVFRRAGFASLVVNSAITMNTPVLFGCVMFIAAFFVVMNLVVDILYQFLDPRIRV